MSEPTFILELKKSQILLIAQLVHIHLDDEKDHPIGQSLLDDLIEQTNCVHKDKAKHLVGLGITDLRNDYVQSHMAWFVPYDCEGVTYA